MKIAAITFVICTLTTASFVNAGESINVYGPGGPAPAMKEAAQAFQKKTGDNVSVTAGPTGQWIAHAKTDADIVFSGSENMMTGFIKSMEGRIVESSVEPIFIRPSTILVRKGNPKKLSGIRDLAKPGVKVLVVEGAGQVGLWEDVVGRTGDLRLISSFRRNIVQVAASSADARQAWVAKPEIDGWLIWNHWQVANSDLADQVEVEPDLRIWRPSDISLTQAGSKKRAARDFVAFLKSQEGQDIFRKWGWSGLGGD